MSVEPVLGRGHAESSLEIPHFSGEPIEHLELPSGRTVPVYRCPREPMAHCGPPPKGYVPLAVSEEMARRGSLRKASPNKKPDALREAFETYVREGRAEGKTQRQVTSEVSALGHGQVSRFTIRVWLERTNRMARVLKKQPVSHATTATP